MDQPLAFEELISVDWQPRLKGTVKRPNLGKLRKEEKKDETAKPKKFFKFGKAKEGSGGNSNESSAF